DQRTVRLAVLGAGVNLVSHADVPARHAGHAAEVRGADESLIEAVGLVAVAIDVGLEVAARTAQRSPLPAPSAARPRTLTIELARGRASARRTERQGPGQEDRPDNPTSHHGGPCIHAAAAWQRSPWRALAA